MFGILGKYANRFGKDLIVFLGMVVHYTTYLLVYYNLPDNSISENVSVYFSFGKLFAHSKQVFGRGRGVGWTVWMKPKGRGLKAD